MSLDHLATNLVPIDDWIKVPIAESSFTSTGIETSSTIVSASVRALLNAEMMATGWILRSSWEGPGRGSSPLKSKVSHDYKNRYRNHKGSGN